MSDNKFTRALAEQERYKRDQDVAAKNRIAAHFWGQWKISVAKYPPLSQVKTKEDFERIREAFPDLEIPQQAWSDYSEAERHQTLAKKLLEKPLSPIVDEAKKKKHDTHADDSVQHAPHKPQFLDHDERYQALLTANPLVVRLRQEQPELSEISSIAEIEAGVFALNPALAPHFLELDPTFDAFAFEEQARESFAAQYASEASAYAEAEKHRIYEDAKHDPEVIRLEKKIAKETADEVQKQREFHQQKAKTTFAYSAKRIDETQIEATIREKDALAFAHAFPQKTAAYAESFPDLQLAWTQLQEEQAVETVLPPPIAMPSQGTQGEHYYEEVMHRNEAMLPSTPPESQQAQEPVNPQSYRRSMPTNANTSNNPSASSPSGPRNRMQRPNPREQAKKLAKGVQNARNTAQGLLKAGQLAARAGAIMANPYFWPVVIIIIIILFILFIIFVITGNEELQKNPDGSFKVNIAKTGPTAVPNPEETDVTKPDASDIEYTIDVSYAGSADSIVVTDPLDDNVEFVSAEGPGNPTYDAATHTVTWNIVSNSSSTASGKPGQPLPTGGVSEIKQVLCTDYNVCPTVINGNSDWNLAQLTALWNVVQRVYESETYKKYAMGNNKLEVARVNCMTSGCDGKNANALAYFTTVSTLSTIPNSRFIAFLDRATTETNVTMLEWVFAHEIGHSASYGQANGSLGSDYNTIFATITACGETVSEYGKTDAGENNAEIIAFYMTAGEESNGGYLGSAENIARDFPCSYAAVKQNYFDGVEF